MLGDESADVGVADRPCLFDGVLAFGYVLVGGRDAVGARWHGPEFGEVARGHAVTIHQGNRLTGYPYGCYSFGMTTTTAPAARRVFTVLGTTDEVTECEHCGRVDLKGTVRLGALDADGNVEGITYFGAVCGARAAGWTTKDIRKAATAADRAAAEAARVGRDRSICTATKYMIRHDRHGNTDTPGGWAPYEDT